MKARFFALLATVACILGLTLPASAHFGMVIPSTDFATMKQKTATITYSFSHPFAGDGMELVRPEKAGVFVNGKMYDLTQKLEATKVMKHGAWSIDYTFKRPGVYSFFMQPKPYWEPAEDCFIQHYTKVCVPAFGADTGWDEPLGLKTEIVPLLRPFGNMAGNTFVGQVIVDGKPVPNAEVEVELYNKGRFSPATPFSETQVIIADQNGVFHFTCPQPGWWGFAALTEADFTLPTPDGKKKSVELGAVFWTYMHAWKK